MKLKDFMLYLPRWFYATSAKHIRTKIPEDTKKYIEDNHLYHITTDNQTADKIIESGYLKPASGLMKYIDSYGSPVACMFAGTPSSDDYIKNLTDTNMKANPYLNPTMISNAIEIDILSDELENFKTRLLADGVIVYKGKCDLPQDRIKKVQLVPDLYIEESTGEKSIKFRKRTEEEIKNSPDKYVPSQEYLQYVLEERQKLGYNNSKANNLINTILHEQKIEVNMTNQNIKYNLIDKLKGRIKNLFQPKLPVIKEDINIKDPYEDFRKKNKYMGDLKKIEPQSNIEKTNEINKNYEENSR